LMEGEIDFDSTPGKGSNFWFTLNLKNSKKAGTETTSPEIDISDLPYWKSTYTV